MKTQPQLTTTAEALASRLSQGSGTSAKLPVTSSRPSKTMLISPTGSADQRRVGLHRTGKGQTGGDAEDGAGQHAADQKIARGQSKLALAGVDHRRRHVGGLDVIDHFHFSL